MNIEPKQNWILVQMDDFPERVRGIIVQEDSSINRIRTGTVLKVGPGIRSKTTGVVTPVEVEPGEKVAFFRWNLEHQNGKRIVAFLEGMGDNLGLIKSHDILFAFPPGTEVDIR